jgi:hypothetical protein
MAGLASVKVLYTLGVCPMKVYGFTLLGFRSKLVCLSKPLKKTGNNKNTQCLKREKLFSPDENKK